MKSFQSPAGGRILVQNSPSSLPSLSFAVISLYMLLYQSDMVGLAHILLRGDVDNIRI